jgi:glycosyltransferase involved in cell wall biosynthesis
MKKRICVVTSGHLSTCPRMLKAADALHEAGYAVRVVCTNHLRWAKAADAEVHRTRGWPMTIVDYSRTSAPLNYLRSGVRFHAARAIARLLGPSRCPLALAARAFGRIHSELVRAVLAEPTDFIYGGTTGGLAVVAAAARRARVPYALDLEDFHSAQQDDSPDAPFVHELAERIERNILSGAAFLTAAGPAIASAYANKYGVDPISVNNTFSLPATPPDITPNLRPGLRLYWFSQTVGPRRGLEDAVRAMGMGGIPGELHIRGNPQPGYLLSLDELAAHAAPQLKIIHHPPAPPGDMIRLAQGYDVGLALEQTHVFNRRIAVSNKAFTYMLAGSAVMFTDTPGQRPLALDLGEAARMYQPGDVAALARELKNWAEDKAQLARARHAAWVAAQRRWHWEHPLERGALLVSVEKVFA